MWSKTSYSGYKRPCHQAGRTNNEQGKIELLSSWKLEAEFRNFISSSPSSLSSHVDTWADMIFPGDFLFSCRTTPFTFGCKMSKGGFPSLHYHLHRHHRLCQDHEYCLAVKAFKLCYIYLNYVIFI